MKYFLNFSITILEETYHDYDIHIERSISECDAERFFGKNCNKIFLSKNGFYIKFQIPNWKIDK